MPMLYCIDSSTLIDLRNFPPDVHEMWRFIDELVLSGQLIAPHEVLRELRRRDDDLHRWAREHRSMFIDLDAAQATEVQRVMQRFPDLHDPTRTEPFADPIVVALALARKQAGDNDDVRVVAEEHRRNPLKIPRLCEAFDVQCGRLADLCRWEGVTFQLTRS